MNANSPAAQLEGGLPVLMLTEYPLTPEDERLGGIMQASFRLVGALDGLGREGVQLTVVTVNGRVKQRVERRLPGGTVLIYLPYNSGIVDGMLFHYPSVKRALRDELAKSRASVVHAQGSAKYILAATHQGLPHIVTVHGIYQNETPVADSRSTFRQQVSRFLKVLVERHYMGRINHLIAITEEVVRFVSARSRNLTVYRINNPIDEAFFGVPPIRAGAAPVVLFVAAITYRKGLDFLLDAFEKVLAVRPDAKLRIAGIWDWDPGYVDGLRKLHDARIRTGQVSFLGGISQDQLIEEMTQATLLCLPSRAESAPMVISQAMAASRPVVATMVGGIPSMVEDGRTGLLSQVGDVPKLASNILQLLQDERLARRMGEAGRMDAATRYGAKSVAQATVAAYRSAACHS